MAEETADPRDVPWHPRHRYTLYGQEVAEQQLLQASRAGKLHHAWLFSGPKGIGKATLAYRFVRFLLNKSDQNATSLAVVPASAAARQIAARSHPDLLVVEPAFDPKTKKLKGEIAVDIARQAVEFFSRTAGAGGWRVAIVDDANDLNTQSANALLKIIEEPPPRTLFLLLANRPGALLRTIRSRCIELPLEPLSLEDTLKVLAEIADDTGLSPEASRQAAELSGGSPGKAVKLAGSQGAAVMTALSADPRLSPARCVDLAAQFGGRTQAAEFETFTELLVEWIAKRAREKGLAGDGAPLAKAHDHIVASLRQADALNLDRRQTATDALLTLAEALRRS